MKNQFLKFKIKCLFFDFEIKIKTYIVTFFCKHFDILHILYCYDYSNTLELFTKTLYDDLSYNDDDDILLEYQQLQNDDEKMSYIMNILENTIY